MTGAAATVVSSKLKSSEPLPAMQQCATRFFPETLHFMGFELTNAGLSIRLSQDIPPFVKSQIEPTLRGFLDACQVEAASLQHFALHPGSIRIVEIIGRQMGLSRSKSPDAKRPVQPRQYEQRHGPGGFARDSDLSEAQEWRPWADGCVWSGICCGDRVV